MTSDTTPETLVYPDNDAAQTLLKRLVAMIETNFRVPAVPLYDDTIEVLIWKHERIIVSVTLMGHGTGHLKVRIELQRRRYTSNAVQARLSGWESQEANTLETWYHADVVIPEAEDDLRSYLTARLTRSKMSHLIG